MKNSLVFTFLLLPIIVLAVPESVEQATDYSCAIEKEGWPVLPLDPLPDDAVEGSVNVVQDYLDFLYPDETIVVGEAVPLYFIPDYNDFKLLAFIVSIDPDIIPSLDNLKSLCKVESEAYNIMNIYRDEFEGESDIHEDDYYKQLKSDWWSKRMLRGTLHIMILGFVDGEPKILTFPSSSQFTGRNCTRSDEEITTPSGDVAYLHAYGFIPYSSIRPIYKTDADEFELNIKESLYNKLLYWEGRYYPADSNPLKWNPYRVYIEWRDVYNKSLY